MPLLDVFWTMLLLFCWTLWFVLLFRVFGDLFRRDDIGGGAKTGWVIFVIFLPFIGTFVYLISQGRAMAERTQQEFERHRVATDAYIRSVAAEADTRQQTQARDLLESGAITSDEFDRIVQKSH
jgi:hypothetical protein